MVRKLFFPGILTSLAFLQSCNQSADTPSLNKPILELKKKCPLEIRREKQEELFHCRVLIVQISADNILYFEGTQLEEDSLESAITSKMDEMAPADRESFQVNLIVSENTRMRIISNVKEQLRNAQAIRIIYEVQDEILEKDC